LTFQEQFHPVPAAYRATPINIASNVWNVGMVMINLMEGDYVFAGNPTLKVDHSDSYNKTYSRMLEDLVGQSLNLQAASRPSLTQLIALTGHGLTQWEKANVKVDGQEVPVFANMTFPDEEFQIGDEAPERMGGPKPNVKMDGPKPKKRKAWRGRGRG
jgi:hypothetical protein